MSPRNSWSLQYRTLALALGGLTAVLGPPNLHADALIFTRAMTASTIVEVFIEREQIRMELEIGLKDLPSFANLLPDDIHTKLTGRQTPLGNRLNTFFTKDLVLRPDRKDPLIGRLQTIRPRYRIQRDEITGQPLPVIGQGTNEEQVVFTRLTYPLSSLPKELSLKPPVREGSSMVSANVGFMVYHLGVPTLDFRYLGQEETMDLDWEDPWFSRFRNRNLRRQYDSPLYAFLYIDPFEVRKEIIVRPMDLQRWIDLGLEGKQIIPAEAQAALKEKVAEFLAASNPVTIDGQSPAPVLDRIHFIERTLRQTRVIDPPEDLPVVSATLGAIFSYPVVGLPQHVFMEWELFDERIQKVPSVATDEAGGMPSMLERDNPVLEWQNFLQDPTLPTLVELADPAKRSQIGLPVFSLLCLALVGFLVRKAVLEHRGARRNRAWTFGLAGAGMLVVMVVLWPFGRWHVPNLLSGSAALTQPQTEALVLGLLKNVYRSFDYRKEEQIYDMLEKSVSGDLLTRIYLETLRSLRLENQGGARAKVKEVDLVTSVVSQKGDPLGFEADCTWNVIGAVGHWGHIHQRRNQYQAKLSIQAVDGVWKLKALELLNEKRL